MVWTVRLSTKEELFQILIRLYQKKYVEWENHTVKILEPIASMIQILKDADYCVVGTNYGTTQDSIYYLSEYGILFLERSSREEGMFRFTWISHGEWVSHIWEIFELYIEDVPRDNSQETDVPELENMDKIVSFTLHSTKDGKEKEKITILENGIFQYVQLWNNEKEEIFPYEKNWCICQFEKWMNQALRKK